MTTKAHLSKAAEAIADQIEANKCEFHEDGSLA